MTGPRTTPGRIAGMLACLIATAGGAELRGGDAAGSGFRQPLGQVVPDLLVWTDTCNTYVLRDGDAAILIDLGDGSALDHLAAIGVRRVEWVLLTHHHREQCQGASRLQGTGAKVAAPEAERSLLEHPTDFRKLQVRLGDPLTIHGSSYVRPPIRPIPLDRTFRPDDVFTWRGLELRCVDTPGNSPGAMTFLLEQNGQRLAFSGDVMLDGARMHTWFDTEWDYGFGAGIRALRQSAAGLARTDIGWLLPSHGPVVRGPKEQLEEYVRKLERLEKLYVRGYGEWSGSPPFQDDVSKPTAVPDLWRVSPHLFKFKRPDFWPNFGLILAESGRALVVDCGLLDEKLLDASLGGLRENFGLKAIDAVIVTHMHGDHFLEAPHLRDKWGARIWALECVVDKMEHPERFDYAAPIQAYGKKNPDGSPLDGVKVDRALRPGESFDWEGHRFTVDWMPGQTEFALCLHGVIDGRKVAFTGDNIFGDPADPRQTGHEAVVAHNSAILEEGYLYAGEYLSRLQPDILVGGHSFVMDRPAQFIERYRQWAVEMREGFRALSPEDDYRYGFDPFWLRAEPYRVMLGRGESAEVSLYLRNFRPDPQGHRIEVHAPPGWKAEPAVLEGQLAGESREAFPLRLKAPVEATEGVHLVALDVTLDGRRLGERFDLIAGVQAGGVLIDDFAFPWSDRAAPRTECRLEVREGRLHLAFDAEDRDIVVEQTWRDESTVDGEDRVEVFFAADAALERYWCVEIDPLGRVHDYAASHYRKFDGAWSCAGLRTGAGRTEDGYRVEVSVPLATLGELLGCPVESGSELRLGLFRAEFHGRGADGRGDAPDSWLSWVRPEGPRPDFHVPSAFRLLRLP